MGDYIISITFRECPEQKPIHPDPGTTTKPQSGSNHPAESMHNNLSSMTYHKPTNKPEKHCGNDEHESPFATDICKECYIRYGSYKADVLKSHIKWLTAILDFVKVESPEPAPNAFSIYETVFNFQECLTWPHPYSYYRGPLPEHDHYFGSTVQGYLQQLEILVGRLYRKASEIRLDPGYDRVDMEVRFRWIVQLEIERQRLMWLISEDKEGRGVIRLSGRGFILD
ncbi:hypothetical protein EYC80_008500 [Monilinia laxa]|uniref:Uncharacterized protein n=1 Tax=Monilinia laxa TaxID=61186 RepID=A0A5N6JQF1_MONLA|nr:hypothetical protein EYC80_008500 [Monilinia laxa]